jgi:hypothetical protein
VLPRITPNVSYNPQASDNPLGDFLAALDRLDEYEPQEVLPAHEYRFDDLHGRIDQLRRHHAERFREVVAAIADGDSTSWGIARRMTWSRPWDEIDGWMRRAAVGEAMAHLLALRRRGVRGRDRGGGRAHPLGAAGRVGPQLTRSGGRAADGRRGGRGAPR